MSNLRRTVVLVAEDDEADFKFLKCMLRDVPFADLFRVSDGEQAVNYLKGAGRFCDRREFPLPHLFIVDLKLPKISGFEILEWMAPQPGFGPMRIYILSGLDSKADRERAHRAGADDYFVKPLSLAHIAALFGQHPAVQ
jgi:DNA-binding response OmpR family regulator